MTAAVISSGAVIGFSALAAVLILAVLAVVLNAPLAAWDRLRRDPFPEVTARNEAMAYLAQQRKEGQQ